MFLPKFLRFERNVVKPVAPLADPLHVLVVIHLFLLIYYFVILDPLYFCLLNFPAFNSVVEFLRYIIPPVCFFRFVAVVADA